VKKFIEYEVEGARPRGRPKRTWSEVVQKTVKHVNWTGRCYPRSRWRKL